MVKIFVIHGSNLNILGNVRERDLYGKQNLDSITTIANQQHHEFANSQNNVKHALVKGIHQARAEVIAVIINTHSSIALQSAVLTTITRYIEAHINNIHARESFRQLAYFSDKTVRIICRLIIASYAMALNAAIQQRQRA